MRELPPENRRKTTCRWGHPLSGENLRLTRQGYRVCRKCAKEARRRNKPLELFLARKRKVLYHGYRKTVVKNVQRELVEQAFEAVRETGSIRAGGDVMPLCKWRALLFFSPRIHAAVWRIKRDRPAVSLKRVAAPAILRNSGRDAFTAVMEATANVFVDIRDDVRADLFVAIAEGRVRLDGISNAVRGFITAYNRREKNSVQSKWGHYSLDATFSDDGDGTLLDVLSDDHKLWQ